MIAKLAHLDHLKAEVRKMHKNEAAIRRQKQIDLQCKKNDLLDQISKLKSFSDKQKFRLREDRKELGTVKYRVQVLKNVLEKKISRTKELHEYMDKRKEAISEGINELAKQEKKIGNLQKYHMKMLLKIIFPIGNISCRPSPDSNPANTKPVEEDPRVLTLKEELEEAQNLELVCGRWVTRENDSDLYTYIGNKEVCARADGNYHLFLMWLATSNTKKTTMLLDDEGGDAGGSGGSGKQDRSPSPQLTINMEDSRSCKSTGVALSYVAQMLHAMENLFPVRCQHRFHYRTFCDWNMSPPTFKAYNKLLNGNVIALCLQQNINTKSIRNPHRTLANLRLLTDKIINDGCLRGPYDLDEDFIASIEDTLGFQDISEQDLIHDDHILLSEPEGWETVDHEDAKMMMPPTDPSMSSISASTTSMLDQPASLVSSALSWATRGWWTSTTNNE